MVDQPISVVVADGECPRCKNRITVKASARGHLTYTCPDDGGCGHQHFDRYLKGDRLTAATVCKKWRKPEYRVYFLDDPPADPPPVPADPAPTDPADPPAGDDDTMKELFG